MGIISSKTETPVTGADYCTLSVGTSVQGEINTDSNIRIDGTVNGPVTSKGRVVIGEKGNIVGNLTCATTDVSGSVTGNVSVKGELLVRKSASLSGDLHCLSITIEMGASFNGNCTMNRTETVGAK